jgi:ABC-type dipeptide/oligopeptide/nickel transport system permease component
MKIFVYKTLFVSVCIFLIFHFTFGAKLKQIKGEIENYKSKENLENIKNKIRKELTNAVEKENYLNADDAKLINEFINKLKQELSN